MLERVVAVGCALGSVREPEVRIDRVLDAAAEADPLTALDRSQTAEPVLVVVRNDHVLFKAQDLARLGIPAHQAEGLRLAQARVGPRRPFGGVDGSSEGCQRAAPVTSRHEHATLL